MNTKSDPLVYASLLQRFAAAVIDSCILVIPCFFVSPMTQVLGSTAIWLLYAPFFESSDLKATLGKYLMGIQLVSAQGEKISFKVSVIRNLLKGISSLFFIGFFFALFNEKKQTLHDLLVDTVVIPGKSSLPVGRTWLSNFRKTLGLEPSFEKSNSDTLSQLERIQALRDKGTLTEEEFLAEKKRILLNENGG